MNVCRHLRIAWSALPVALLWGCEQGSPPAAPPPAVAATPAPGPGGGSLEPSTLIAMDIPHEGAPDTAPRSHGSAIGIGIRPGSAASGISP